MIQRMKNFSQNDIISIRDLSKDNLEEIYSKTNEIIEMKAEERREIARGKTLGYLFFEPSTRTRLSFQSAMALLGGTSFGIADATSSSVQKGESLADTVRIMSGYTDAIVLRHSLDGSSKFAAEVSSKPIINAGSGTEEHPTQAIQDLYTIKKELGKIDGKNIGIAYQIKDDLMDWKNEDKLFNLLVKKSSDPRVVFNKMEELLKSYAEKASESLRKIRDSDSKHNLEELVSFTEFKA